KSLPGGFLRADTFENAPGLTQRGRRGENVVNLITSRKRAPVHKDQAIRVSRQEISCSLENDMGAVIVLPRRVLDLARQEQGVPDLILAQQTARSAGGQLPGERALPGAGKPSQP